MAWTPTLPAESPPDPGWWNELSYNRTVNRGRAAMAAREQEKRSAEIRRRTQLVREALCLMESAPPAYRAQRVREAARHLGRGEVELRSAGDEVEPFVGVQVDPRWQAWLDEGKSRTNRVR